MNILNYRICDEKRKPRDTAGLPFGIYREGRCSFVPNYMGKMAKKRGIICAGNTKFCKFTEKGRYVTRK